MSVPGRHSAESAVRTLIESVRTTVVEDAQDFWWIEQCDAAAEACDALAAELQRLREALERSENDWVFVYNLVDGLELVYDVRRALAKANIDRVRAALAGSTPDTHKEPE